MNQDSQELHRKLRQQECTNSSLLAQGIQIRSCTRCGSCVVECPVFEQLRWESSSPRGHIGILKGLLYGYLPPDHVNTEEYRENLDLCMGCKRCELACPVGIKIVDLITWAKYDVGGKRGFSLHKHMIANYGFIAKIASRIPKVNRLLELKPLRLMMEMVTGIDSRRRLPQFSHQSFLKWFKDYSNNGRVGSDKRGRIVYFAGCHVIYSEPQIGEALVKIFEALGFEIVIPEQRCCNIAALNKGMLEQAEKYARFNVKHLLPWVRKGYDIITSCPSGIIALKEKYQDFFNFEGIDEIANHTFYVSKYLLKVLGEEHIELKLGHIPEVVAYHKPCHLKVLPESSHSSIQLLELIPELRVEDLNAGCCGLGGTYGLSKKKFDLSLRMGSRLFKKIEGSGADRVSADCGACKIQIEQGANLNGEMVEHPIVIFWLALREGMKQSHKGE